MLSQINGTDFSHVNTVFTFTENRLKNSICKVNMQLTPYSPFKDLSSVSIPNSCISGQDGELCLLPSPDAVG